MSMTIARAAFFFLKRSVIANLFLQEEPAYAEGEESERATAPKRARRTKLVAQESSHVVSETKR